MGVFGRRAKDSVRGTAQIVAASHYRGTGIYQTDAEFAGDKRRLLET